MKADGSILIDTKIIDDGMEKGFELIKDEMSSVGITAKQVGKQIELSFSKMDVSRPIANAVAKVEHLEQKLAETMLSIDYASGAGRTSQNDRSVAKLVNDREILYEKLSEAREKLSAELAYAIQKEAEAEEKAAQAAIMAANKKVAAQERAAEKEAKAKKRIVEKQFDDMLRPARRFGSRFREILSGALIFNGLSSALRSITSYFGTALSANQEYTRSLSALRGSLMTAFQPIYEFVLPAITTLINWLNTAAQVIGKFFSTLTGKSYSQMQKNAKALNNQANAISGVGDAAEEASKQLAGFDEINRLDSANSAAGGSGTMQPIFNGFDMDRYSEMIDRFIAPLQNIDFTALRNSLSGLGDSFSRLGTIIKDSLEWAWFEILVPLGEWTIEEAAPEVVATLASALGMVSEILGPVVDGLKQFWEWIQPIVEFVQDTVVLVFQKFQEAFDALAQTFREKGPEISDIISNIGETLSVVWDLIQPTIENLRDLFDDVFSQLVEIVGKAIDKLIDVFYNLSEFVTGFLSKDWQRAWDGLKNVVQNTVSFIIDMLFGLKDLFIRIFDGILQALYDVLTTIDNFFGGGSSSASSNARIAAPYSIERSMMAAQMPYIFTPPIPIPALAQGAVLPANRPFLAVVGDQKNGTNIEAPLDTIKQAVAEVMAQNYGDDRVAQLLETLISVVESIEVGDDVIGKAAARYNRREARARGY